MNYLAHFYLAVADEEWQLGAWLGDFVRGDTAALVWPERVVAGIQHHRALDTWTDAHPLMQGARERAPPALRRYMGIVWDLFLDAWLCRHWQGFSSAPLEDFAGQALALLQDHHERLPPRLQRFAGYAQRYQVLGRYHEEAVMDQVLQGVAGRLSRPGPLAQARELWLPQQDWLNQQFALFFPQARIWSEAWIRDWQQRQSAV